MLRSFLTITFRILWRNQVTTFVNVFGLSVGMATFVFIMLYVHHETSYDKFNKNYDRIYRLEADGYGKFPPFVGEFVKDRMPEVENIARFSGGWDADFYYAPAENLTAINHVEAKYFLADSTVFKVFTFPFVKGDARRDGRNFPVRTTGMKWSPTTAMDILVNETLVKEFGLKDPVGQGITVNLKGGVSVNIIGVVKDFHYASLHDKIKPMVIIWIPVPGDRTSVRMNTTDVQAMLNTVESEWKTVFGGKSDKPFNYQFLDDNMDQQYKSDEQLSVVIGLFTVLAVIIACLGLFALSSFMVTRRTKEIGVRKVLGASLATIYLMLSWDFLKWILVAAVVACPIAWYLMQLWLESFAYHITVGPLVIIIAVTLSIAIALITITWQSLKAASANPVMSLRYE